MPIIFDEFIVIKGETPYTGDSITPPESPWTIGGAQAPLYIAPSNIDPLPVIPPFNLGAGDFCLEIDIRLDNLFQWIPYNDGITPYYPVQYYGVLSQFTQSEDGSIEDGGNYWSLYLRVNIDYSIDAIFDVYTDGVLATHLVHSVVVEWSGWDGIVRTHLGEEFIHLCVSRKNDDARLFVDGNFSHELTAAGALANFTPIDGDWQIMGPTGQGPTYQPNAVTTVNNFRVFDYAYRWDDFDYVGLGGSYGSSWDERRGICIYPMIDFHLISGKPGDIRAISGLGI